MTKPTPVTLPEIHFDSRSGNYWLKAAENRYLELSAKDVKLHMKRNGFYTDVPDNFGLKSGDAALLKIQLEKFVDYAGPLAGHKCGLLYTPGERRVLVTSQAHAIEPKRCRLDGIEKYLAELFGNEQSTRVLYWLKVGWEAMRKRQFRPGQISCLCGPAACGKSFFHVLVTKLLGGRSAKPYRYMSGQSNFNSDLAGAEHLVIEDENARAGINARREFGTAIKNWTVNEEISVHAKGREAITLPFFRRLSLSVNDEPEYLQILPPMDNSILDKVNLFKCHPATLDEDRRKNIAMLDAELPGLAFQLERLPIPRKLRDARFGVVAYHNPDLLQAVAEISPENRLESIIDQVLWKDREIESWIGSAEELEMVLRRSEFSIPVDRLFSFTSACGTYLARLAARCPERYTKTKNGGRTKWTIRKEK